MIEKGIPMTKPTLYGVSGSRAIRSIWMAEELAAEIGFDYVHVPTHFIDESKTPEYKAINPNGRVPALVDGDVTMFESLAINLFLSKKYNSSLSPVDLREDGLATQWSMWALTEMESAMITVITRHPNIAMFPYDADIEAEAMATLDQPLKVLDAYLADHEFLVADRFMVADLNVAAQMALMRFVDYDLDPYPHVLAWVNKAWARPALATAQAK
jgi:glutathione S-transferase